MAIVVEMSRAGNEYDFTGMGGIGNTVIHVTPLQTAYPADSSVSRPVTDPSRVASSSSFVAA